MADALLWTLKTAALLCLFHFIITPLVHAIAARGWAGLGVSFVAAVASGVLMAWANYRPFVLFLAWLAFNRHSLKVIGEDRGKHQIPSNINTASLWVSSYVYVVLSCILAYLFQARVVVNGPTGEVDVLLWRCVLGWREAIPDSHQERATIGSVASPRFLTYAAIGALVSFVSGFGAFSQGRFFKNTSGQALVGVCGLGALALVAIIAYSVSIFAAVAAFVAFFIAARLGASLMSILRR